LVYVGDVGDERKYKCHIKITEDLLKANRETGLKVSTEKSNYVAVSPPE